MKFFNGCTALITGASAGLGEEFARQLAPYANALVLVARRADRLEKLKTELMQSNSRLSVYCYALDLADLHALEHFTQWLSDEGIRPNFLINNAGLGDHGLFESSDWKRVQSMIDVNVTALTRLTHDLLPVLRGFEDAAILNVSSTASYLPVPQLAVYAATKAYVTSFSEALRAELRGTGVSVTALCPGPIDTEFNQIANQGREGQELSPPEFLKVHPADAVHAALRAVAHDRPRIVPGWAIFLLITFAAALPMFLIRLGLGVAVRRTQGKDDPSLDIANHARVG